VIFNSALADAQIGSDVLARLTGENQFHDLALSNGQTPKALLCGIVQPKQPEEQFLLFSKDMAFCALSGVTEALVDWSANGVFKCIWRNRRRSGRAFVAVSVVLISHFTGVHGFHSAALCSSVPSLSVQLSFTDEIYAEARFSWFVSNCGQY
jgi:hypothetical protein